MAGEPWYSDGLRFGCTRCGNCCTGEPGMVRATDEEVLAMARLVAMDEHSFRDAYTHRLGSSGTVLREGSGDACVFWREEVGCLVYEARPTQCRTWPFWRANVATPAHWRAAGATCPGIGGGELHAADEIERASAKDGTSGIVPELGTP